MVRRAAALALVLLGLAAPAAAAQGPAQDSVSGTISHGEGRASVGFAFNPTGTVTVYALGGALGTFPVSCLGVSANRATIVARFPPSGPPVPAGVVIEVEDNGSSGDKVDHSFVDTLPSTCPAPVTVFEDTYIVGDVTVVDAPEPPTTYAECRQAGWVKYGFASHAGCNEYVHDLARRKCIFERAAHGISAFRAKYGAMRRCVRLYTGF
jgi:hypothetical protein